MGLKFSQTHGFWGTILHPYSWNNLGVYGFVNLAVSTIKTSYNDNFVATTQHHFLDLDLHAYVFTVFTPICQHLAYEDLPFRGPESFLVD